MILNTQQIKDLLPHRYPFLLVDRVIEMDISLGTIIAQKNVTINEEFFVGHFPNAPIMPAVLIVEAMAQTVGILGIKIMHDHAQFDSKKTFVLAGINRVRIKKFVIPGDVLIIKAFMQKSKLNVHKSSVKTYVNNIVVSSAEFTGVYTDIMK